MRNEDSFIIYACTYRHTQSEQKREPEREREGEGEGEKQTNPIEISNEQTFPLNYLSLSVFVRECADEVSENERSSDEENAKMYDILTHGSFHCHPCDEINDSAAKAVNKWRVINLISA